MVCDTSSVAVFACELNDYGLLRRELTEARLLDAFAPLWADGVARCELQTLDGLNVVIGGTLNGGVTSSLRPEPHGKSLSFLLLRMALNVDPDAVVAAVDNGESWDRAGD